MKFPPPSAPFGRVAPGAAHPGLPGCGRLAAPSSYFSRGIPLVGIAERGGNGHRERSRGAGTDAHDVVTNLFDQEPATWLVPWAERAVLDSSLRPCYGTPCSPSFRSGRRHDLPIAQPFLAPSRPGRAGMLAGAKTEAVAARIVDMQPGRDLGVPERQEHLHAVPAIHRVITGLRQEHGRGGR